MRRSNASVFFILAVIMVVVAVLRWFMKGWMDAAGMSETLGSMLVSLTIVLLIGLVIIFAREGRAPEGRYWNAGGWWIALSVWQQALVIAGILLAAKTGASTYYSEMIATHKDLPTAQHIRGHSLAIVFVSGVGLLLGWGVYAVAKRGRRTTASSAA